MDILNSSVKMRCLELAIEFLNGGGFQEGADEGDVLNAAELYYSWVTEDDDEME